MWFWISIASVLFVLWLLARRVDRRRGITISRRVGGVEGDAARGRIAAEQHRAAHDHIHGQSGPLG